MSDIIYCPHCGAKNEAGANYCCRCGKSIYDRNYAEAQVYEPASKKKTAMIIIIVLVAAALAIAATLVWVHFFKPVKVDLTANITKDSIVLSGHNGKGKAVIDNEKLRSLADYDRGNKRAVNFMKSVNYSLDKNTNLSNGDTVTLTANWSHATANSMHVSINDISKEIKISGLTKKNTSKEGTNYNYDTSYKTSDYFILPNSDTEYVTEQDLDGLSAWELKVARNEIYARHGYIFREADLKQYFNKQKWYEPKYSYDEFSDSWLSSVEAWNVAFILQHE